MFHLKVFMMVLVACFSLQLQANPVADFYAGSVPVNDRSQVSFKQGMNEALLQVLVKTSAEQPGKLVQNPALAEPLSNAERFAAQFLYKTQVDVQPDGSSKNQLYLQATFPEKIIMDLLKKGNVRFWPSQRSPVLLLPVINVGGAARLATAADAKITDSLSNAGRKYGVPFQLGGNQQEDAQLLWNGDAAYINKITAAYNKKIALVLQMTGDNKGRWLLVDGTQVSKGEVSVDTLSNFTDKGMAWAAGILAGKQSVELTSAASRIDLLVSGIDTYEKYEKATTYLKNISIVDEFMLTKIENGTISATLKLTTGIEQLEKSFLADKRITMTMSETGQKSYHWNE